MPYYQKRGQIPNKRHIQFRDDKGDLVTLEVERLGILENKIV